MPAPVAPVAIFAAVPSRYNFVLAVTRITEASCCQWQWMPMSVSVPSVASSTVGWQHFIEPASLRQFIETSAPFAFSGSFC